ncbi:MAG TPA: hypothetical protein VK420_12330 [Longimicrobium sp.]|nr:hypothetical protein [Longimicrobium sp.]
MTGPEFRERRTRAGIAIEQVAVIARVPASTADAWERGGRLPYLKRRRLDLALWEVERDVALAEPGAPACSVVDIDALTTVLQALNGTDALSMDHLLSSVGLGSVVGGGGGGMAWSPRGKGEADE